MTATRKITVLIADDHAIVKEGLVSLLKEHDFDVVGAVGDGRQLLESASRLKPDVIVTDLTMPLLGGLDVLPLLKAARIESKVIVLTMHNDGASAARLLRGGASAFLLKESAGEELINAIHQVLQGRVYITPGAIKAVMEQMAGGPVGSEPELTPRHREVLRLIVEGQRMKEIAAALQLSPRTVETHKYEMMAVLGVQTTAELIRYAVEHKLVTR